MKARRPLRPIPQAEPQTPGELVALLEALHDHREAMKADLKRTEARRRRVPSRDDRALVHAKTAGRCYICGGEVDSEWQADHVLAHGRGGAASCENYLPAHKLCNGYRWDYLPAEFQYILKLGVWTRTQIEKRTALGLQLASAFIRYEQARRQRAHPNDVGIER
jgi:hypothetical protein